MSSLLPVFTASPSRILPPAAAELHVWCSRLTSIAAGPPRAMTILSEQELDRAGRLRFAEDRSRFVQAHRFLREVLGAYLGLEPREVRFTYGRNGKPELGSGGGRPRFNLSHSSDVSILAVTRDTDCGVDVERVRDLPDADEIARRFFTAREFEAYQELAAARGLEAFFTFWTCKEAFVKAIGEGLSAPLDSFEVSVSADGGASVRRLTPAGGEPTEWSLFPLRLESGYVGAVAVPCREWSPSCWLWTRSDGVDES